MSKTNGNRLTQQTFHSGAKSIFGYDSRNRQTSVDHKTSSNAVLSSESYVYNGAGNLTSKTVDSVTTTYTYDDIDQLLTESRTGYSATYTYDANGNRASKTLGGVTETYTNDDADKLTSISSGGVTVKSFGYDAAGRTTSVTTSAGTTTLAYDYESRVTTITYPSTATNTFTYNGLDTRVGKVDSAGTATYKRDGAYVTDPLISDGSATYTHGISERRSSTTKYFGADRLGTNSLETNSSQAVTASKAYDAFGMPVAGTGSSASPFGFAGQHGYQEDGDSGLKLLGHRYYDASTGRFLTRDPVKDGRNWYTYCGNCPTKHVDPTGLILPLIAWGVAAIIVAVTTVKPIIEAGGKANEAQIIRDGEKARKKMLEDHEMTDTIAESDYRNRGNGAVEAGSKAWVAGAEAVQQASGRTGRGAPIGHVPPSESVETAETVRDGMVGIFENWDKLFGGNKEQ